MPFPDSGPLDPFDSEHKELSAAQTVEKALSLEKPSELYRLLLEIVRKLWTLDPDDSDTQSWNNAYALVQGHYEHIKDTQHGDGLDKDGTPAMDADTGAANDTAFFNIVKGQFPEGYTKDL